MYDILINYLKGKNESFVEHNTVITHFIPDSPEGSDVCKDVQILTFYTF